MSARTHTRSRPAQTGGIEIQLPWWAIALPAVAFAALLLLIVTPSYAQAASGDPAITHVLERIQHSVLHETP